MQGQSVSSAVTEDGSWSVSLEALETGGPYVLNISTSSEEQVSRQVYVGEVYLCTGQSIWNYPWHG